MSEPEKPVKPTSMQGHVAFCPCGAPNEIPRFTKLEDVARLDTDLRRRIATFARNGGIPVVAQLRCDNCTALLDVSP